MPTVSIEPDRTWITDATDPSTSIVCGTLATTTAAATLDGAIRHYAGNRVQAEVYDQDDLIIPLTIVHISPNERQMLFDWRGRTVLLRRPDGSRYFCVYFAIADRPVYRTVPEDDSDVLTYNADVSFQVVSYDEAV